MSQFNPSRSIAVAGGYSAIGGLILAGTLFHNRNIIGPIIVVVPIPFIIGLFTAIAWKFSVVQAWATLLPLGLFLVYLIFRAGLASWPYILPFGLMALVFSYLGNFAAQSVDAYMLRKK